MPCALYFTKLSHYTKEMMLVEGIPFIFEGKQMFLPFMGMFLTDNAGKRLKPVLRNPVITKFQLVDDIGLENKAGISALCKYSLLSDNAYPTYAITKKELHDINIKSYRQVSAGEEIGCQVLEVGYFIDYREKKVQDPFSVMLSLSEEEQEDDRVQTCVDEMLEEYVW